MSIFSQNMDEFELQAQALESVHLLISKYRQTGLKNSAAPRTFNLLVCIQKSEEKHLLVFELLHNGDSVLYNGIKTPGSILKNEAIAETFWMYHGVPKHRINTFNQFNVTLVLEQVLFVQV